MFIILPELSQEFPGIMLLQLLYSLMLLQGLIQRQCLLEESGRVQESYENPCDAKV